MQEIHEIWISIWRTSVVFQVKPHATVVGCLHHLCQISHTCKELEPLELLQDPSVKTSRVTLRRWKISFQHVVIYNKMYIIHILWEFLYVYWIGNLGIDKTKVHMENRGIQAPPQCHRSRSLAWGIGRTPAGLGGFFWYKMIWMIWYTYIVIGLWTAATIKTKALSSLVVHPKWINMFQGYLNLPGLVHNHAVLTKS